MIMETTTMPDLGQPTRSERRYAKVVASIERQQRKLEKSDRAVKAAIRSIVKLERTRRRLQKKIAADETAKANGHVMAAVPEPEPVEVPALDIPPFLQREPEAK